LASKATQREREKERETAFDRVYSIFETLSGIYLFIYFINLITVSNFGMLLAGYDQRQRMSSSGRPAEYSPMRSRVPARKMVAIYDYNPHELSPNVDVEVIHTKLPLLLGHVALTSRKR